MRRHTPCYAHLSRRTPLTRIGPYSTCIMRRHSRSRARGTLLPPATAASVGDPGGYRYLQLAARPMRRRASSGDHLASR